ncbi:MAG: contractile injection system tape measure protein [Paracoccaceae bacterium]|nr:contractile injection system tape measure protein [Paracoccaceae bacterium]
MSSGAAQKTMAGEPVHSVGTMVIDFDVVSGNGPLATPEAILSHTRTQLLPVLEQVLEDLSDSGAQARAEVLEIDLGDWPEDPIWSDVRRSFSEKLLSALRPYLRSPRKTEFATDEDAKADVADEPTGQKSAQSGRPDTTEPPEQYGTVSGVAKDEAACLIAYLARLRLLMRGQVDAARRAAMSRAIAALVGVEKPGTGPDWSLQGAVSEAVRSLDAEAQSVLRTLIGSQERSTGLKIIDRKPSYTNPSEGVSENLAAAAPSQQKTAREPNGGKSDDAKKDFAKVPKALWDDQDHADPSQLIHQAKRLNTPQSVSRNALASEQAGSDVPQETERDIADTLVEQLAAVTRRAQMIEGPLAQLIQKSGTPQPLAAERAHALAPHIAMLSLDVVQDEPALRTSASNEDQETGRNRRAEQTSRDTARRSPSATDHQASRSDPNPVPTGQLQAPTEPDISPDDQIKVRQDYHDPPIHAHDSAPDRNRVQADPNIVQRGHKTARADRETKPLDPGEEEFNQHDAPMDRMFHPQPLTVSDPDLWMRLLIAAGHPREDVLEALAVIYGSESEGPDASPAALETPTGQTAKAKPKEGDPSSLLSETELLRSLQDLARDQERQINPGKQIPNEDNPQHVEGIDVPAKAIDQTSDSIGLAGAASSGQSNFTKGAKELQPRSLREPIVSTITSVAEEIDFQSGKYWRAVFDMIWRALPIDPQDANSLGVGSRAAENVAEPAPLGDSRSNSEIETPGLVAPMSKQSSSSQTISPDGSSNEMLEPDALTAKLNQDAADAEASPVSDPKSTEPSLKAPRRPGGDQSGEPRAESKPWIEASAENQGAKVSNNKIHSSAELEVQSATDRPEVNQNVDSPEQDLPLTVEQNHNTDHIRAIMALVTAPRGPDDRFEAFLEARIADLFPDIPKRRNALRQVAARLSYSDRMYPPHLRQIALSSIEQLLSVLTSAKAPSEGDACTETDRTGRVDQDAHPASPARAFLSERGGLILFHPYLPMLFERLALLDEKRQIPKENMPAARRALQVIADQEAPQDQPTDPVEKMLLGLPQNWALPSTHVLTPSDVALINSLLVSVIERWGALGQTSADGLREAFIRRNAVLKQQETGWILRVDIGPFDMLLDRLPWSFGTIALPWMPEPCIVHWRDSDV